MLLEWSCQERDDGYAFYGHPLHYEASVFNLRYLWFKILYDTTANHCRLQIHFDDHWHGARSLEWNFAKLSEAWNFAEAVIKYLHTHPEVSPLKGIFS